MVTVDVSFLYGVSTLVVGVTAVGVWC